VSSALALGLRLASLLRTLVLFYCSEFLGFLFLNALFGYLNCIRRFKMRFMKKDDRIPLPVSRSLSRLGQAMSLARRRRHLSQQDVAERIGASVNTLRRMEAGYPGTALVHFARAMQVFGELGQLDQLLDTPQDAIGLALMDEQLPQRVRKSRKTPASGAF
jgi:DNA-binding XRE family transcriptional regulator